MSERRPFEERLVGRLVRRPYRDALPLETVFGIMEKDAPRALDAACLDALKASLELATSVTEDLLRLSSNLQTNAQEGVPACTPVPAA